MDFKVNRKIQRTEWAKPEFFPISFCSLFIIAKFKNKHTSFKVGKQYYAHLFVHDLRTIIFKSGLGVGDQ